MENTDMGFLLPGSLCLIFMFPGFIAIDLIL